MGGGNGQKAKMARERNLEKMKAQKGILSLYPFVSDTNFIVLSFIHILLFLNHLIRLSVSPILALALSDSIPLLLFNVAENALIVFLYAQL